MHRRPQQIGVLSVAPVVAMLAAPNDIIRGDRIRVNRITDPVTIVGLPGDMERQSVRLRQSSQRQQKHRPERCGTAPTRFPALIRAVFVLNICYVNVLPDILQSCSPVRCIFW